MTKWGLPRQFLKEALAKEADECILWPFAMQGTSKYPAIHVRNAYGKKLTVNVTRIVCGEAHGPAPSSKHEAAHSCHEKRCINKRHLSWQTRQQNAADTATNWRYRK